MFSELPKLLGRNFAIGFFLPAAAFSAALWFVFYAYHLVAPALKTSDLDALLSTTIAIAVVWLVAIAMMALNYPFLRFLEGYGDSHPLKWRIQAMKRRFRRDALPALQRQAEIDRARAEGRGEPEMPEEHPKQLRRAVETYPDDEDWILPTRFGNAFRAVEVYPRVIYGLDAVPLWPRLQAVLPQQFRDTLEESKAQLDFCLNIMLSAVCITLAYAALALWYQHLPICWIPIIGTLIAAIGYLLALSAVGQYGLYLKSAFDLYRQELAEQLGYELPQSIVGEREMWQALSRMMIYRSSARAEQVVKFRALERKP